MASLCICQNGQSVELKVTEMAHALSTPDLAPGTGSVTLSWLLLQSDLALSLVEPREVPEVRIRFGHAIELEDPSPWLTGGELVLTTGLRLARSHVEQSMYVERLATVGVAALAFGIGVRFASIPTKIQETCARLGLPLIEVPLPTPFVAITQAVSGRLAEQHNERNQRSVDFQEQMTRAALHDGTHGLVQVLARELACATVVVDDSLIPLEQSATAPVTLDRIRREIFALSDRPGPRPASVSVVDEHGPLEIRRLGGKVTSRGWMAVTPAKPLEAADRMLFNQAASMITLQLDRPRELTEAHRRLGSTVLELLFDSGVSEPSLVDHLSHFGFTPHDLVRVLLVKPVREANPPLTLISERLATASWPHVVTSAEDGVVALVRSNDAREVVDAIRDALQHAGQHGVTLGVSGPLRQSRVSAGREAATQAATSARWCHEAVGWYDQLSLEAILADATVRSRIRMLAESPLSPLLDSKSSQHRKLVRSLEIYLRSNGSWETASRALGIHRHTLRKQMAKVEELTGSRLDVAEDRVALLLALMVHQD